MRVKLVLTPTVTFVVTIVFTLMLGVVDWASGNELQFFVFYFVPVAIAGWTCNSARAYFIAVLSAVVWFVAAWFSGQPYTHISYTIWNTAIRLVAFLILGYATLRIKVLLVNERKLSSELQKTLSEVKTLTGLLPICANCKKIRNDEGYWQQIEIYIEKHSDAQFSHGYCHECADKLMKEAGLDLSVSEPEPEGDGPKSML
jgi:hypothetical protein